MRKWISLVAVVVVLALNRPAHAQLPYGLSPISQNTAVGVGPAQQFPGVATNLGNPSFVQPNVLSSIASSQRMNLGSTGFFQRLAHMSFFPSSNSSNLTTTYPDMGMAYLQGFGYRQAQQAK